MTRPSWSTDASSSGGSTVELAERLHVSERTVKRAVAALLRKLRATSRTEAAALAGTAGLLSTEEAADELPPRCD